MTKIHRSIWCAALVANVATPAYADEGALSPVCVPDLRMTPPMHLGLGLTSAIATTDATGSRAFGIGVLGVAFGLPRVSFLPALDFGVSLPLIGGDESVRAGSALGLLRWAASHDFGPVRAGLVAGFGVYTPTFAAAPRVLPGLRLATADVDRKFIVAGALSHPRSGLSVLVWNVSDSAGRTAVELGYKPALFLALHAGVSIGYSDHPAAAVAGIAVDPGDDQQLALEAYIPMRRDPLDSYFVALSFHTDISTPHAPRAEERQGSGDMRVLGPSDVRARVLSELAVPGKTTIIEFGATWCAACKVSDLWLESLAASTSDVAVRQIDVDDNARLFRSNFAGGIPAYVVFSANGRVVGRQTGFNPTSLSALIAQAR